MSIYKKQGEGVALASSAKNLLTSLFFILSHSLPKSATHLLAFQHLPHSLQKMPGCTLVVPILEQTLTPLVTPTYLANHTPQQNPLQGVYPPVRWKLLRCNRESHTANYSSSATVESKSRNDGGNSRSASGPRGKAQS